MAHHMSHCTIPQHQNINAIAANWKQPYAVGQRVYVIHEADTGHQRDAQQERPLLHPEECGVEPHAQQVDDAATAQHDALVRTALIGFVNDIALIRNAEINQFRHHQQRCYY